MNLRETLKYVVYRAPVLHRAMSPKYPYKVDPGELCALIEFVDATREVGGAVVEIGVAQGDTSVFLLEHLRTMSDEREVLLFDTFEGFTEESIEVEVHQRAKRASDYEAFRYGDEAILRRNIQRLGYTNFKIFKGDAAAFDWSSVSPVGAVLLDIDLYAPTKRVLEGISPYLCAGGGIVVDDCLEDTPWDGAFQAYLEFTSENGYPFERVGHTGAIIRSTAR
jgi:hypothetical protein